MACPKVFTWGAGCLEPRRLEPRCHAIMFRVLLNNKIGVKFKEDLS